MHSLLRCSSGTVKAKPSPPVVKRSNITARPPPPTHVVATTKPEFRLALVKPTSTASKTSLLLVLTTSCVVGAQIPVSAFAGSPQVHAILNKTLLDFFSARTRARQGCPYDIPAAQLGLLDNLGLERPVEGSPTVPHALHKVLEESHLRLMSQYLVAGQYGLISCKTAKVSLLPTAASIQNPIIEARDVSRYPGSQLRNSSFAGLDTFFMHDVSSQVGPHELVEKLVSEQPNAHLFVTGVNPAEVLTGTRTFVQNSHHIEYEGRDFQWLPYSSVSEGYTQPIQNTISWWRTSSIVASNGNIYQVVLLDEKLGHCLWHIFCGDVKSQDTRMFSTGNNIRIPAPLSGTGRDEYINAGFANAMLDFPHRTNLLKSENLSAKATQLSNGSAAQISSRERRIGTYLASLVCPNNTWSQSMFKIIYKATCLITFNWSCVFHPALPDVYDLISDDKRTHIIHPTQGGGWSQDWEYVFTPVGIRNCPSALEKVSAFTAMVFCFAIPKIAFGQALVYCFHNVNLFSSFKWFVDAFDATPTRAVLFTAVAIASAALPNHVSRVITRLSGHHWRLLWIPFNMYNVFCRIVAEITGGPGHTFFRASPGRGWAWQISLLSLLIHEILPGIFGNQFVPLFFLFTSTPFSAAPFFSFLTIFLIACTVYDYFGVNFGSWYQPVCSPLPPAIVPQVFTLPDLSFHCLWDYTELFLNRFFPISLDITVPVPRTTRLVRTLLLYNPISTLAHLFASLLYTSVRIFTFTAFEIVDYVSSTIFDYFVGYFPFALSYLRFSFFLILNSMLQAYCSFVLPSHLLALTPLATSPSIPAPALRVRNFQTPIPVAIVQTLPSLPAAATNLGISPLGMTWNQFFTAVSNAYNQNPNAYPALTPNMSCFFDCMAGLGGTSHMWFSWYHSLMGRQPGNLVGPFGPVSVADMSVICALAQIGMSLDGDLIQAFPPSPGYPTLAMTINSQAGLGMYHVVPQTAVVLSAPISALARLLGMVNAVDPRWFQELLRRHNANNNAATVSPAPLYTASYTGPDVFNTYDQVSAAFAAAPLAALIPAAPVDPAFPWNFNLFGVGVPLVIGMAQAPSLVVYTAPPAARLVAGMKFGPSFMRPTARTKHFKSPNSGSPTPQTSNPPINTGSRLVGVKRVPEVPRFMTLAAELKAKVSRYSGFVLPATSLSREDIMYQADLTYASLLAADLKAHPSVLESPLAAQVCSSLDAVVDSYKSENRTVSIPIHLFMGTWGCGKTTMLRSELAALTSEERRNCRIVAHTDELRAELKSKLDFPEFSGFNFPTLASIILEPSSGRIYFDDAGKFWGGILDLVIITNPLVTLIGINGDPGQGITKFPIPGTQSERVPCMIRAVSPFATRYATISHRVFKLMAQVFGMQTTNPNQGFISHVTGPQLGLPVVTASPRYVQVLSSAGREAYTYDTIQGKDFDIAIENDVTGLEGAISDATAGVALSRSKVGVFLHGEAMDPTSRVIAEPTGSDIMNAILYEMKSNNSHSLSATSDLIRSCHYAHLHRSMPSLSWFARVGYSSDFSEFSHILTASPPTPTGEMGVSEFEPIECVPQVHVLSQTYDREITGHKSKEQREVSVNGSQTDQFRETAFINPPAHHRRDTPTYQLGVQQRLTPSTLARNTSDFESNRRQDMCDEYDRLCPDPPKWTPEIHDELCDLVISEYVSRRDIGTVMEKIRKHDPDRTGRDIVISMKGQVIKKSEKKLKDAVPPQLIHEYDIACTLSDAPYFLFLERYIIPNFPPHIEFFSRESMSDFIKRAPDFIHKNRGTYASDATRWDVGCDAPMLNFDVHVFRKSNIDESWVSGYIARRLNSRSQHGVMKTMQNSGDRGTWPMNTVRRAVVSSLILHVTSDDTLVVNGDDAWLDRYATADFFPDSPWFFKDENAPTTEFSGLMLSQTGKVSYSPTGLQYRCWLLEERGVVDPNRWMGYADLLSLIDTESPAVTDIIDILSRHISPAQLLPRIPAHLLHSYTSTRGKFFL